MSDIVTGVSNAHTSELEIYKRVSWGAIFSGTLVALSMELVFLTFGLFIGFQMTDGDATAWTKAWYLVGVFFSLLIGAWAAARLAGNPSKGNGMLHGFVVWGLTMFTTAVISGILLWDVVKAGMSMMQTAIGAISNAPAAGATVQVNTSQMAANLANAISDGSLIIFFGLLLALAGSLIGGMGTPSRISDLIGARRHRAPEEHPRHA